MVTCAKQLSSGYLPIAALMISGDMYDVLKDQSRKHGALGMGYTYGGHPVAAAVALETLKIYEERDMLSHVQSVAGRFADRLAELSASPLVGEKDAHACSDSFGRWPISNNPLWTREIRSMTVSRGPSGKWMSVDIWRIASRLL